MNMKKRIVLIGAGSTNFGLDTIADPVVDNVVTAEKMLNNMIEIQKQHLGYLI